MAAVTGVHRALYNADILSQVLSYFTHPPIASRPPHIPVQAEKKPGIEEKTLAYAARVCKAFSDVALRKLWSSLPDLLPLWLILSALQVVGDDPNLQADGRNFRYTLVGEIPRDNWERFRDYARLIREVRYDETSVGYTDPSIWVYLNRYLNGDCLLPNLHTLAFSISSPHETALLTVVSPSLRKLDIYFAFEARLWGPHLRQQTAVDTLFQTAFTYTPGVRDLMLHMCEFSPTPLLRTAGSRLKHLRRLDLSRSADIGDEGTLRTLADIQTLEVLDNVHPNFADDLELDFSGFPVLQKLSVNGDARSTAKLLATLSAPLDSFQVKTTQRPSRWLSQFPLMRDRLSLLRTLMLDFLSTDDDVDESCSAAELLEPLAPLRALESLRLGFTFVNLRASDADLEQLAAAFTQLVHLTVYTDWTEGDVYPTARSLATFARLCPRLETLVVPPLQIPDGTFLEPAQAAVPVQRMLRRLCISSFCALVVSEPEKLGALVAEMFPNLDPEASVEPPLGIHHLDGEPGNFQLPKDHVDEKSWNAGKEVWRRFLKTVLGARVA